jgi:hypothetical protein
MTAMHSVQSSSIQAIGYDPRRRELLVRYRGSPRTYGYAGVTQAEYRALEGAPSKGVFVNARIKGRHPYRIVPAGPGGTSSPPAL